MTTCQKRKFIRAVLLIISFLSFNLSVAFCADNEPVKDILEWQNLPDMPQTISGHFAGVSNDALVVAGGAYFPTSLFKGGEKVWVDTIFVLESGKNKWETGFKLDHPLAYGASITTDKGVICIGGSDGKKHYAEVLRLQLIDGKIEKEYLPDLPEPCAFTSAAMLNDVIYVAGGQSSPEATVAMKNFWALDLSKSELKWEELEPWPGPPRILPVVSAQDDAFYLISGAELLTGKDEKVTRRYLTDAYRFKPKKGWDKITDVPSPVVAAPSTAYGQSHILVFGGDDGENADRVWELKDKHPGFSHDILAYHIITNTWAKMGKLPAGLVTTNAVWWQDSIIIPGGEDRPGHRSAKVYKAETSETKAHFGFLDYGALVVYLLSLVIIGIYFSRREKSTGDFFLAGRRVPWWAAGISVFGTQLSAITFMAIPAKSYATNWVYFLGNMCIVLIAPVVVFLYLPFFRRLNVTTAYEYLEKRFSLPVRLFGSTAFTLFQFGRMAIVLFLPAIALSTVTGISVYTCILVMGILCIIYTVLGGIEAVIWSDVLQVVVLMGGALLSLIIIAVGVDGGVGEIFSIGLSNAKFHTFNWTWDITVTAVWVVVIGNLLNNLIPYTSDQTVVQRYLTTKDEKQAAQSVWTNAVLTIPASIIFFGLGTALFVFYKTHPNLLNPSLKTDAIFPWFITQKLPVGISGLVIAGLFAAAMSSVDSSMNSVATVLVTDFYRRFKPDASDHTCLNLARWLTGILGVIGTCTALLMATYEIKSLWDLFIKIIGLFGGSMAGLFALGIFTRRAHGPGALIGAVIGAIVQFLVQNYTQIHFFLYGAIGIITCVVVGYFASLIIPAGALSLEGLTIFTIHKRD